MINGVKFSKYLEPKDDPPNQYEWKDIDIR
jgi:hypothetical protein